MLTSSAYSKAKASAPSIPTKAVATTAAEKAQQKFATNMKTKVQAPVNTNKAAKPSTFSIKR